MNLRRLALLGKIAFTLALGALLLRQVDLAELGALVHALGRQHLLAAGALLVLQSALLAVRWQRLLVLLGQHIPFGLAWRWLMVGLFFNQALPTSVGGDAFRIWCLHRRGAAPGIAFASVAIERSTGLVLLACLIAACVPLLDRPLPTAVALPLLAAGPLLALVLGVVLLAEPLLQRWLPTAMQAALVTTCSGLRLLLRAPGEALVVTLLGLAAAMCGLGGAWVLGLGLGLDQPLQAVIVVLGGAMLVSLLPVSLGGWGVREASVVVLFSALGVAPERALAMSVAFGLLQLLVALPGGLLWWLDGHAAPTQAPTQAPALDAAPR